MQEKFDVVEIEIMRPLNRRVMARGLSKDDAEAYVKTAVFRQGVVVHIYKAVATRTFGAVAQ